MGAPILAGSWFGDVSAGLMASIGGFTALYGSGRPYVSRALELGAIVLAFALSVSVGLWVAPIGWAVVIAVALIAMIATWLANAFRIGPAGAYMFTLACAAATAMPIEHLAPLHAGLLVLSGGAFAWLVQMSGALFEPRGPERRAVANAGKAVIAYLESLGQLHENSARHHAALALHDAWIALVNQQPVRGRAGGELSRLRSLNRELHLLFADALRAVSRQEPIPNDALDAARDLVAEINEPRPARTTSSESIPPGHPGALTAAREALRTGSNPMRVIVRVGVAALVVGSLGAALHFERAYWAVAAAVLMLHQGFDWPRMLRRSVERLIGTWIGLALAGAILIIAPQGVWLALTVMVLQFTIEMLVVRNYALAAIFITGVALTIASGGHPVESPGEYLLARGLDTIAGCLLALVIFRLIPPRAADRQISEQLLHTLHAIQSLLPHLTSGAVTSSAARIARQRVQHASFALVQAYEESLGASRRERRVAEHLWPAIAATERLAYRTLSVCWALERLGGEAARQAAQSMFENEGGESVQRALQELIDTAANGGRAHVSFPALPAVLAPEIENLRASFVRAPSTSAKSEQRA